MQNNPTARSAPQPQQASTGASDAPSTVPSPMSASDDDAFSHAPRPLPSSPFQADKAQLQAPGGRTLSTLEPMVQKLPPPSLRFVDAEDGPLTRRMFVALPDNQRAHLVQLASDTYTEPVPDALRAATLHAWFQCPPQLREDVHTWLLSVEYPSRLRLLQAFSGLAPSAQSHLLTCLATPAMGQPWRQLRARAGETMDEETLQHTQQALHGSWENLLNRCYWDDAAPTDLLVFLTTHATLQETGERIALLEECFDGNDGDGRLSALLKRLAGLPAHASATWTNEELSHRIAAIDKTSSEAGNRDVQQLHTCCDLFLDPALSHVDEVAAGMHGAASALAGRGGSRRHLRLDMPVSPRMRGIYQQIIDNVAAAPRSVARTVALLGNQRPPPDVIERIEGNFEHLREAANLLHGHAPSHDFLTFLQQLDTTTLIRLNGRLNDHGLTRPGIQHLLQQHGVESALHYLERPTVSDPEDFVQSCAILAAALADSAGPKQLDAGDGTAIQQFLQARATGANPDVNAWVGFFCTVLRALPSDAHRRWWTGENGESITWLSQSSDELRASLRAAAASPARALSSTQGDDAPVGPLEQAWRPDENVMLDERRALVDESVRALLDEHPLDETLPTYRDTDFEARSPAAKDVVRYMRRLTQLAVLEIAGREVPIYDIYRLVLRSIETHRHATGDAAKTHSERENMYTALANNLASGVMYNDQAREFVCHVGLCERMIRALSGYHPSVQVLFVTPKELVNNLAADVQQKRTGPLDAQAVQGFMARCQELAADLYGNDAERMSEIETLARLAVPYLQE